MVFDLILKLLFFNRLQVKLVVRDGKVEGGKAREGTRVILPDFKWRADQCSVQDPICQQQFMETNLLAIKMAKSLSSICGGVTQHLKMAKRTSPVQNDSDEESFEPEYHQIKKLGFKINKKKICTGGWSSHENQVYLQFMLENTQDFLSEKSRRKTKVFYRLSKILKKRTPDQCRSHHQKLQLKYKDDLYAIINEVQRKIHTCVIQEYMSEQHRLHQKNYERMREEEKEREIERKYKTMIDGGWFNVKSCGSCLKFSIDPHSIRTW